MAAVEWVTFSDPASVFYWALGDVCADGTIVVAIDRERGRIGVRPRSLWLRVRFALRGRFRAAWWRVRCTLSNLWERL